MRGPSGIRTIVSGGQTGVDRAALDAALDAGIACAGWCPAGRWAEDGPIDARYPLRETPSSEPAQRTAWNVRDSDATLILSAGEPSGGTLTTIREAAALGRPVLVLDPAAEHSLDAASEWLRAHEVRVLNVAGPRGSEAPGIYRAAHAFLRRLVSTLQ